MRRWRRDGGSIARQVALILLGSLFLAHVLSGFVWFRFAPTPPSIQVLASRIELAARTVAAVAPAERDAVVAAASRSGLGVSRATTLPATAGHIPWRRAELLESAIRREGEAAPLRVVTEEDSADGTAPATASVALDDGTWLVFRIPPRHEGRVDFAWFAALGDLLFGALPLALLSIWAARRVTGPLVRLAAAAEHVGTIEDPLPLPEEGTREIRKVARALNGLIEKLRRFVFDRTRMLAAISHDLRTPLTRLRLRAESVADPVIREKMLQDIVRMDQMISSTLAFIREDGLQESIEPVDIAALLLTICDAFADAGADVAYVGALHCAGACRPQAMERALTNLIDNAVKFGGSARVTLHGVPADGARSAAVIDVEDDGPGIAASQREEVFKPFTRGDSSRRLDGGGVGLGLAIARSIIHAHGGSIELSNLLPTGLRVRVQLPGRAVRLTQARAPVTAALATGI